MLNKHKYSPAFKRNLIFLLIVEALLWGLFFLGHNLINETHKGEFIYKREAAFYLHFLTLPIYLMFLLPLFRWEKNMREVPLHLHKTFFKGLNIKQKTIRFLLFRSALFLLIIALAQPLFGTRKASIRAKSTEIVLALDVSNSMNTMDIESNISRLSIAKRATIQLINELKGERLGILIFAGNAFVQLPITKDYEAAKLFVNEIDTKMISNQGTNFEAAIEQSRQMFSKNNDTKSILMITDGENHEEFPESVLENLPDDEIFFAVVGIGTREGGLIPQDLDRPELGYKLDETGRAVVSKMDVKLVRKMAEKAEGVALICDYPFPNLSELLTEINQINKGKLRDLSLDIKRNHYHWPLMAGCILWILGLFWPISFIKGRNN
jgi:Ca-activated chloride channel family protein